MNAYLLKFQHKNASTGKAHAGWRALSLSRIVLIGSPPSLTPRLSPRGPMGLPGRGEWEANRSGDELLDPTDGLPYYSSGPGTSKPRPPSPSYPDVYPLKDHAGHTRANI